MLLSLAKRSALLALVGVGALTASAHAASSPVVQIRNLGGKLTCSGTLVAPRYVLTAGHCAKTTGLTVRERGKTIPEYKVATVVKAPKTAGHRPDLALVQLTAPSATAPVALFAGHRKARSQKKLRVRGWAGSKTLRSVAGRRLAPRRCGKTAARPVLCARVKQVPSIKCRDAAGASLLARQSGQYRLTGIGIRTRTGCRKHPRARFADATTASVRTWIAATVQEAGGQTPPADPGPTPGPGPVPGGTPPPPPADTFIGKWQGSISEDRNPNAPLGLSYPADLKIDSGGSPGDVVGRSTYTAPNGSVDCTGTLTLGPTASDGSVSYTEHIDSGQANCIDGGVITLAHVSGDPSKITYTWQKPGSPDRSSGTLSKTG